MGDVGNQQELRIDEIVGLLHKVQPSAAEALKNEFPEHSRLFDVGQTLGGGVPADILLAATQRSLETIVPWGESAIGECSRRLLVARKLELGGSLVAMIGSGTCAIFASVLKEGSKTVATAIVAMFGNICVALGGYYRGSILGTKPSLEEAYSTLLQSMPELRFIEAQARSLMNRNAALADADISVFVNRAQALCKEVYAASNVVPKK